VEVLKALRDEKDPRRGMWDLEELEEHISKTMFAMYDIRRLPALNPKYYAKYLVPTKEELRWVRSHGVYFYPSDALFVIQYVEVARHGLPETGQANFFRDESQNPGCAFTDPNSEYFSPGVYLKGNFACVRERIGSGFRRRGAGVPYVLYGLIAAERGVGWTKDYVTVDQSTGKVTACGHGPRTPYWIDKEDYLRETIGRGKRLVTKEDDEVAYTRSENVVASALNQSGESSLLWKVEADEGEARAIFGVHEEQVKSLFYARTLPLSETGRKRPILHWVAAHRRRIKEGIEVDVRRHMRGITEFVLLDTKFTITNPPKKAEEREAKRLRRIYDKERARRHFDDAETHYVQPIAHNQMPWWRRVVDWAKKFPAIQA
jgi:hypothetical protein